MEVSGLPFIKLLLMQPVKQSTPAIANASQLAVCVREYFSLRVGAARLPSVAIKGWDIQVTDLRQYRCMIAYLARLN